MGNMNEGRLPLIGILPNMLDGGISSVGMSYTQAIEAAGGMPILLPYTTDGALLSRFAALCDGFLFTGGVDIHPARFGERISPACGQITPPRDEVELAAFRYVYPTGKPILGICRGCQLLNVALGGTVVQDIPSAVGSAVAHQRARASDPAPSHRVEILESTPLRELFGASAVVSSYHHQAIGRLGAGLEVMATAADGVIEAAFAPAHPFLWAIQWHPERDASGEVIFRAFVGKSGLSSFDETEKADGVLKKCP